MRLVRSIFRWSFGLGALVFLRSSFAAFTTASRAPRHPLSPLLVFLHPFFPFIYLALGIVFAMAWHTVSKSRETRNWWAVTASIANTLLSGGIVYLGYLYTHTVSLASPFVLLAAVSVAGIFLFAHTGATKAISAKPAKGPKRERLEGDATSPWIDKAVTGVSTLATLASVHLWASFAQAHHLRFRGILSYYFVLALAYLFTATLHELGHAAFGRAFHMRLLSFQSGPFSWRLKTGNWRFKFTPTAILSLGGAVGLVPTRKDQPRWQGIAMLAAGPGANIVTGVVFLYLALHLADASHIFVWKLFALTSSTSFIAAIVNLLPFQIGEGAYSDGARILQQLSNSPVANIQRCLKDISSTLVTPLRPRDYDVELLQNTAPLCEDNATGLHLCLAAASYFEDNNRFAESIAAVVAAEEVHRKGGFQLAPVLHTPFIYTYSAVKRDPVNARLWATRMKNATKSLKTKDDEPLSVDHWIAMSALHWAEGNYALAEEAWQKANEIAQTLPAFGAYEFDRSRIAYLRQRLDQKKQEKKTAAPIPISAAATAPEIQPKPAAPIAHQPVSPTIQSIADRLAATCAVIAPNSSPAPAPRVASPADAVLAAAVRAATTPIPAAKPEPLPEIDLDHKPAALRMPNYRPFATKSTEEPTAFEYADYQPAGKPKPTYVDAWAALFAPQSPHLLALDLPALAEQPAPEPEQPWSMMSIADHEPEPNPTESLAGTWPISQAKDSEPVPDLQPEPVFESPIVKAIVETIADPIVKIVAHSVAEPITADSAKAVQPTEPGAPAFVERRRWPRPTNVPPSQMWPRNILTEGTTTP